MKVKFKKLCPEAVIPTKGSEDAAAFDLVATSSASIYGLTAIKYGTGLAMEIPQGYAGFIFPRSSCYKAGMSLTNCVGVIDSDYRGEISAVFRASDIEKIYNIGDRIAQIIIMPVPKVEFIESDTLSETKRGIS